MSLQTAIQKLSKKYGPASIIRASDAKGLRVQKFSSGSVALDFALNGGLPVGRIISYVGEFSSCKTTLALKAAAAYLRLFPEAYVVFVDVEGTFDPVWAERLGVDISRLVVVAPDSGEQAADAAIDAVSSEDNCFVIVDSLAAMTVTSEIEESMDKQSVGLHPRMINKMMRKIGAAMKRRLDSDKARPTVLLLNQRRDKIGVMWGSPESYPGGHQKEHSASVIVRLQRKEWIVQAKPTQEGEAPKKKKDEDKKVRADEFSENVGMIVGYKILKNKVGGLPQAVGTIRLLLKDYEGIKGGTIDNTEALVRYGIAYKIIGAQGNTYTFGKEKLAVGREALSKRLRNDTKVRGEIRKALMQMARKR